MSSSFLMVGNNFFTLIFARFLQNERHTERDIIRMILNYSGGCRTPNLLQIFSTVHNLHLVLEQVSDSNTSEKSFLNKTEYTHLKAMTALLKRRL